MAEHHTCVVVGAGISGLAAAWWLQKAGVDVLVLEGSTRAGGTMQTLHEEGWTVESGPNSALETTPLFRELFADLGLESEVIYASDQADKRFILRDRKLHTLPLTPPAFLASRLWSLRGKTRLLGDLFVGRAPQEETVAQFVTRRLGREFLDYAIDPFVAGVFAGDPSRLSVRAAFPKLYALEARYGGLIKGQILGARERKKRAEKAKDRARLFSFRSGMSAFPAAIASKLHNNVRTAASVERIDRQHRNGLSTVWKVGYTSGRTRHEIEAETLVLSIPAYAAAGLLAPLDPKLADALSSIYYPPVVEIFLGYDSTSAGIPLDGFGFLIPGKERRQILGTIWTSSIFPGRAPEGSVALTTFVGGSRQPEMAGRTDAEIVQTVQDELRDILKMSGKPTFVKVTRWQRAIPQYHLGHLSFVGEVEKFEQRTPGIFLGGNYRGGISVGDCVMSANALATRVAASQAEGGRRLPLMVSN